MSDIIIKTDSLTENDDAFVHHTLGCLKSLVYNFYRNHQQEQQRQHNNNNRATIRRKNIRYENTTKEKGEEKEITPTLWARYESPYLEAKKTQGKKFISNNNDNGSTNSNNNRNGDSVDHTMTKLVSVIFLHPPSLLQHRGLYDIKNTNHHISNGLAG